MKNGINCNKFHLGENIYEIFMWKIMETSGVLFLSFLLLKRACNWMRQEFLFEPFFIQTTVDNAAFLITRSESHTNKLQHKQFLARLKSQKRKCHTQETKENFVLPGNSTNSHVFKLNRCSSYKRHLIFHFLFFHWLFSLCLEWKLKTSREKTFFCRITMGKSIDTDFFLECLSFPIFLPRIFSDINCFLQIIL